MIRTTHLVPLALFALVAGAALPACERAELTAVPSSASSASKTTTSIQVEGMTCSGCEQTIQSAVAGVPGVLACKADHVAKTTTVDFDPAATNEAQIAEAIRSAGYQTPGVK